MISLIIHHNQYPCKDITWYTRPMIIGVDTGGTKTLIASFSDDGTILENYRFPTPRDQQEYIAGVVNAIKSLAGDSSIFGICVAVPGVVRDQIAVICKNLGWHNFDVLGELKKHFPDAPMWLENDANLGGLGATMMLDPKPSRCLYITVSTGIGGGFIYNQKIEPSISENEIGDIYFEYDGKITHWEDIASGRAIMRDYGVYASQLENDNDIKEISKRISRGLLALLPVLQPEIVAVGGGFGAQYELFADYVKDNLSVLPEQYHCPIVTAPHPEEIVAYGCYFYAKDHINR